MGISRLFAFFVALSLLFGPLAMDRAMAATPATNHSQMAEEGHCKSVNDGKAGKAVSKSCCAAMCATAAVILPQTAANERFFARLAATAAPANFHRGVLSEISTPPPRLA